MGYNGMCGPKWSNGFSDVLVRNWVSILVIFAILASNRAWVLHLHPRLVYSNSSLELSVLFSKSCLFTIIDKTINTEEPFTIPLTSV